MSSAVSNDTNSFAMIVKKNFDAVAVMALGAGALGFEIYEKVSEGHLDDHKLLLVVANLLACLTIVVGLERFFHFSSMEK
jgi:hypothetical protein